MSDIVMGKNKMTLQMTDEWNLSNTQKGDFYLTKKRLLQQQITNCEITGSKSQPVERKNIKKTCVTGAFNFAVWYQVRQKYLKRARCLHFVVLLEP